VARAIFQACEAEDSQLELPRPALRRGSLQITRLHKEPELAIETAITNGSNGHHNNHATQILIEAPRVTITGPIAFDAPDTAALLTDVPEFERYDQIRRILEMGTQTIGTISTSTTLRMVEAQMTAMTQDLNASLGDLLTRDRSTTQTLLKELLDDHRTKVTSTVTRYLDPESQASLPVVMGKVFDEAGATLTKRVETLLSDGDDSALGRLADRFSKELAKSTALIVEQLAAKHALVTRSALAGRPYENDLEERLVSLARPLGDQVVRCGDTPGLTRRKSGDMLITIAPETVGGRPDVRIVVEAKRRDASAQPFSPTDISKQLSDGRRNRGAKAGLFVTEVAALLPLGLGFHEYGSADIAVAWDRTGDDTALAVAYRLLRWTLVEDAREAAGEEIDREVHSRVVADIRVSLAKLDTVRTQQQAAINSINRAATAVNDVGDSVLRGLRQLDELMGV
jgi:hypothetical protein